MLGKVSLVEVYFLTDRVVVVVIARRVFRAQLALLIVLLAMVYLNDVELWLHFYFFVYLMRTLGIGLLLHLLLNYINFRQFIENFLNFIRTTLMCS